MRKSKYNEDHINKVELLVAQGMKEVNAIKKAGFGDPKMFYATLTRYSRYKKITYAKVSDL